MGSCPLYIPLKLTTIRQENSNKPRQKVPQDHVVRTLLLCGNVCQYFGEYDVRTFNKADFFKKGYNYEKNKEWKFEGGHSGL